VIPKGKKANFLKWLDYNLDFDSRTFIMGILNITPDSFFDGGSHFREKDAVSHALRMVVEGVDIIDIGGESTRPFSDPLPLDEEIRRVIPVIKALSQETNIPISIDTYKSEVASEAIKAGATIVNDISALRFDPAMGQLVADAGIPIILMHMKGTPKNMQVNPTYKDLFAEIIGFLSKSMEQAVSAGIKRNVLIIDPGIGFGKSFDDNLKIIKNLQKFSVLGQPILIGPSHKAFIGHVLGLSVEYRETGTMAAVAASVLNGANIVRVHNVGAAKETVTMIDAILKTET
jgi:dihydropteroate synthase